MNLTRRFFLQSSGALAVYLGISPALALPAFTRKTVLRNKTLVVLFLRGGADGLNLVVPFGDANYTTLRKTIGIPAPTSSAPANERALDLDGYFGLHPRLSALMPMFNDGSAVAAHAVGYANNTRSHFEEQDTWETGVTGNTINSDGWLNRHLVTSQGRGPIRAVSIGNSLPRILHGKASAYAIRGLDDLTLPKSRANPDAIAAALEHAYCTCPPQAAKDMKAPAVDLLSQTAATTLEGIKELREIARTNYTPVAPYPETELGRKLLQVARLIKADVGLEVAEVDLGGWDTHQNEGGAYGQFATLAQQVGDALAAFTKDLGDRLDDTLIITMTDFGRTAAENGTGGTDHGWANCMFLAGGPVLKANQAAAADGKARKVVTQWPGLAPDQLYQKRDLLHTTDFRDVLAEAVSVHLGNPNLETILPSHTFKPVGLVKA